MSFDENQAPCGNDRQEKQGQEQRQKRKARARTKAEARATAVRALHEYGPHLKGEMWGTCVLEVHFLNLISQFLFGVHGEEV
jgi:hypothetical protein